MDPLYYIRVASAGWIVVAVILASLWAADAAHWRSILELARTNQASVALAILAAITGVGAPPVVGILLERVSKLILLALKRDLWRYPFVKEFHQYVAEADKECASSLSAGGIFHVVFYSQAKPEFLSWFRRRISHQFSSVTSAIAIAVGIAISVFVFDAFSWPVISVSAAFLIALVWYAEIENQVVLAAGSAWVKSYGRELARGLAKESS